MNIDNIYFIYSNVDKFPTINSFMFLQVVYPQMATNTTGKVNLGQEGKPSYYNCVLHVYALIKTYENLMRNLCHTCHTELMESSSKFVLFIQMKKSIYPHLQAKKVNVKYYLIQFLLRKAKYLY